MDSQQDVVARKMRDVLMSLDNPDKYLVFLLSLGFSITETAKLAGVTRPTVYRAVSRTSDLVDRLVNATKE